MPHIRHFVPAIAAAAILSTGFVSCAKPRPPIRTDRGAAPAGVADAEAFVKRYNEAGDRVSREASYAAWVQNTYITSDTQWLAAKANERWLKFRNGAIAESKRFNGLTLEGSTGRAMRLIQGAVVTPAPRNEARLAELTTIMSKLRSMYGTGQYCKGQDCRDLEKLQEIMSRSRDYAELLDAWQGWRTVSPAMREKYTRFAALMNEGARELGFQDTGDLWKSAYDMQAAELERESERLWQQVKPLYEQLHCHVRAKLGQQYGTDKVPADGPIPAHLLGNMWAQRWGDIFDLVRPYPSRANTGDIDKAMVEQQYTPEKMVKSAESFYQSLGLTGLPETFWSRSMFIKPQGREVVCHPSAWPLDPRDGDVRIKMCIDVTRAELEVIYHELGHIYYYLYYRNLPFVFQAGAHDGFHEAIGDALTLSMTPDYYKQIGLVETVEKNQEALINQQMQLALDEIAFLPFGKLIDRWRWDVFSGETSSEQYNAAWWQLRRDYQGIAPPTERTEADFDPGAKYHIPMNTPYMRYFFARILQFQFHQAMCEAAGHQGPLHECSIYQSEAAGKKLADMLALGQSVPWPDALEKLTGTRAMDSSALIAYFQPLMQWLEKENQGRTCGW